MKKIVCLILAVALFAMPVFAADIDLASMSDEELLELQTKVTEELEKRALGVSAVLTGGKYVGGVDIKTGRYVFTLANKNDDAALVYLYGSMEDCQNDENELESGWVSDRNNMSFTIGDGQVLVIREDVIATFAPALPFAPDGE